MSAKNKYDSKKPSRLISLMAGGHTFEGACGIIGISRGTGYSWSKKHPDWKEAKEIGMDKRLAFLECLLKAAVFGNLPKTAPAGTKRIDKILLMFWLKTVHRDLYSERFETDNVIQGDMIFRSRIGPSGEVMQEISSLEDWENKKTFDVRKILEDEIKKDKEKE